MRVSKRRGLAPIIILLLSTATIGTVVVIYLVVSDATQKKEAEGGQASGGSQQCLCEDTSEGVLSWDQWLKENPTTPYINNYGGYLNDFTVAKCGADDRYIEWFGRTYSTKEYEGRRKDEDHKDQQETSLYYKKAFDKFLKESCLKEKQAKVEKPKSAAAGGAGGDSAAGSDSTETPSGSGTPSPASVDYVANPNVSTDAGETDLSKLSPEKLADYIQAQPTDSSPEELAKIKSGEWIYNGSKQEDGFTVYMFKDKKGKTTDDDGLPLEIVGPPSSSSAGELIDANTGQPYAFGSPSGGGASGMPVGPGAVGGGGGGAAIGPPGPALSSSDELSSGGWSLGPGGTEYTARGDDGILYTSTAKAGSTPEQRWNDKKHLEYFDSKEKEWVPVPLWVPRYENPPLWTPRPPRATRESGKISLGIRGNAGNGFGGTVTVGAKASATTPEPEPKKGFWRKVWDRLTRSYREEWQNKPPQ